LGQGSRVIVVAGPAKMAKPEREAMLGIETQIAARKIEPHEDVGPGVPLMQEPPKPGSVAKTSTIAEVGITEWTLGNGARVILKPTDFDNDVVRMAAFSPGGTSLVKDTDYVSAQFADDVMSQAGIGPFDAVKLKKALAGKIVAVRARIAALEEGLSGRASPSDLETLCQMIHLPFTAPRRDPTHFPLARETENVKTGVRPKRPSKPCWFSTQTTRVVARLRPRCWRRSTSTRRSRFRQRPLR
jgi:zinc protease